MPVRPLPLLQQRSITLPDRVGMKVTVMSKGADMLTGDTPNCKKVRLYINGKLMDPAEPPRIAVPCSRDQAPPPGGEKHIAAAPSEPPG